MWLGRRRGQLVDWLTQLWVVATGRRVDLAHAPWLDAPAGPTTGIGDEFFSEYARAKSLELREGDPDAGLIPDFSALASPTFDPGRVQPEVATFYEHTAAYEMDAWSEWCGAFRPFGRALAWLFSRRLQQLNVPLSPLDTSRGVVSEVLQLKDPAGGLPTQTAWVRKLVGTGNVLYAGSYSLTTVPGHDGPCVKVAFPLPNGNALVIMRPEVHEDGSLSVTSSGGGFGDPGFYFTVHRQDGRVFARYVRALKETIRVYRGSSNEVRADHTLWFSGLTFLRLHYRLRRNTSSSDAGST